MKKQFAAAGRDESTRRGRGGARKCPCCGRAPCACGKSCFCQEPKAEMTDDEADDFGVAEDLRFSFLRHAEQSV